MTEPAPNLARQRALRYALAVAAVALAALLRWLVHQWLGQVGFFTLFYPAVLFAVFYGGAGPALVATALSATLTFWLFLRPDGISGGDELALGIFCLTGLVLALLSRTLRQSYARRILDQQRRAEAALRDSEARSRAVLETAVFGILTIDDRGIVASMNPAAERLFGYSASEVIGQNVKMLMPSPDRERHDDYLANYIRTGKRKIIGIGREVVGLRKNGEQFPMDLAVSEMWVGGKRMFTGLVYDVTERKRFQEELLHAKETAEAAHARAATANRMKDEFLATLSHELRTPLNAILGWARLIRSGKLDPETSQQAMEAIERNAAVQARLIEDLLDVSRIISGKLRIDLRPVDVPAVIQAAMESVMPAAEAKQIQLVRTLETENLSVRGDPARLQQVVWNLLSNAIKFTPRGGRAEVHVAATASTLRITVSDTGMGISPQLLPYVFDRFRQGDSSTTRSHAGLGLGLAIARHLVELHGGTIDAHSEGEGKGARFTIHLPLSIPRSEGSTRLTGEPSAHPGQSLRGVRVLVVDDEPDARSLVRAMLEPHDAQVCTAESAAEAAAVFHRFRPHVLISDLSMPQEDGYALIRRIRSLPPDQGGAVPAVALTAMAAVEDRTRAVSAGFQVHLPKPVEPEELVSIVAGLSSERSHPGEP